VPEPIDGARPHRRCQAPFGDVGRDGFAIVPAVLSPRKHKISRLEEFSDAVFGFALTLLALSSGVPANYTDLMDLLKGVPAFACAFALMVWIWHEHDTFFERYPLEDGVTTVINSVLLFVVLVYVYPLKFMFESFMAQVFGLASRELTGMSLRQLANASILYGLGFFILMSLFSLLYLHAYRRRDALGLDPLEVFDTRSMAGHHAVSASVGLFAMFFAIVAPVTLAFLSPSSFALMGPAHWYYGTRRGKARRDHVARLARATVPQAT
jgi:uncharacterized membrane protein